MDSKSTKPTRVTHADVSDIYEQLFTVAYEWESIAANLEFNVTQIEDVKKKTLRFTTDSSVALLIMLGVWLDEVPPHNESVHVDGKPPRDTVDALRQAVRSVSPAAAEAFQYHPRQHLTLESDFELLSRFGDVASEWYKIGLYLGMTPRELQGVHLANYTCYGNLSAVVQTVEQSGKLYAEDVDRVCKRLRLPLRLVQ